METSPASPGPRGDHECANDIECYKPLEFAKQQHFEACSPKRRWRFKAGFGADLLEKKTTAFGSSEGHTEPGRRRTAADRVGSHPRRAGRPQALY